MQLSFSYLFYSIYIHRSRAQPDLNSMNMKILLAAVVLVASFYPREVDSFTLGAPIFTCDTLTPSPIGHLGPPQNTTVPFTIDVSSFNESGTLQYTPGQAYTGKTT